MTARAGGGGGGGSREPREPPQPTGLLYGKRFTVCTDHSSLQWLRSFHEPEGQVARWLETLSQYDCDIVHRPGKKHTNADSLSRMPCSRGRP